VTNRPTYARDPQPTVTPNANGHSYRCLRLIKIKNKNNIIYLVTQLGTNTLMYIDYGYSRNIQFYNSYRVNRFKYHSHCVYHEIKRTDVNVKLFKC